MWTNLQKETVLYMHFISLNIYLRLGELASARTDVIKLAREKRECVLFYKKSLSNAYSSIIKQRNAQCKGAFFS